MWANCSSCWTTSASPAHHRDVLHRQRPALQHLARRRHHALPQREELELGRRLPRPVLRPLAGQIPAGETVNGIVAHEDWLPTFAAAGNDNIVEQLKAGVKLNGRNTRTTLTAATCWTTSAASRRCRPARNSSTWTTVAPSPPSASATGRRFISRTALTASRSGRSRLSPCVHRIYTICVATL
jgi:hypothetical protein